jgi:hypothetical protein
MTLNDLADILAKMYKTAPKGEAVLMIHLFGVKYADEIRSLGLNSREIVEASGLKITYKTEVNKGMNLSKYVIERV